MERGEANGPRRSCTTLTTIHERAKKKEKPFLLPPPLLGATHPTPPPPPPPPPASILSFSLFRSPRLLPLSSPGRASGTDDATKAERGRKEKNLLLLRRHLPPPPPYPGFLSWRRQRRPCRVTALPLSRPFSPQFEVVAVAAAPPPPALSYLPKPGALPLLLLQQSLQKGSPLPQRSLHPGECCFCMGGERERGGEEKDWMGGSPSSPSWIFLEEEKRDAIAPLLLQKSFFWS